MTASVSLESVALRTAGPETFENTVNTAFPFASEIDDPGKIESVDVERLRQLELKNCRPRKLVAERDLDIEILEAVAAKKW